MNPLDAARNFFPKKKKDINVVEMSAFAFLWLKLFLLLLTLFLGEKVVVLNVRGEKTYFALVIE